MRFSRVVVSELLEFRGMLRHRGLDPQNWESAPSSRCLGEGQAEEATAVLDRLLKKYREVVARHIDTAHRHVLR